MASYGTVASQRDRRLVAEVLADKGMPAFRKASGTGEIAIMKVATGQPVLQGNLRSIVAAAERLNSGNTRDTGRAA